MTRARRTPNRRARPGGPGRLLVRRLGRLAAVLLVGLLVLLDAGPASAHSELTRSDPPNGGMVVVGRTFLTLWFEEPVNLPASSFDLHDAEGTPVTVTVSADDSGAVVRLDVEPLARATFEIDWRVVSLSDGHPSSGTLLFGAGTRPDVVPSAGSELPQISLLVLRWIDLAALLVVIGALVVSGRVLEQLGASGHRARRHVRFMALIAGIVVVYAGALTPLIRIRRPGNPMGTWFSEAWATLIGTPWGRLWLAREVALLVAVVAITVWWRRAGRSSRSLGVALGGLGVACWLDASAGHASGLPTGSAFIALASAGHVLAAGVWAGGLVVLVTGVPAVLRRDAGSRRALVLAMWHAYSPLALVSSLVLLATGLFVAGAHVPSVAALGESVYGASVAAKTALVALALLLAGLNRLVLHPATGRRVAGFLRRPPGWTPVPAPRMGTLFAVEALVLVAAVAFAALATSVPTSREITAASQVTSPHSDNVDGLFLTFEEVPSGPGKRQAIVRERSTILPAPAVVSGVEVVLVGPDGVASTVPLEAIEEGRWEAEVPAPVPGGWQATVTVHRTGLRDAVTVADWTVADPDEVATGSLRTVLDLLAVLLLLLVGLVVLRLRRRTGRRPGGPSAPRGPRAPAEPATVTQEPVPGRGGHRVSVGS